MSFNKKEYRQKYYQEHKNEEKIYQKNYYYQNKNKALSASKNWKSRNKSKLKIDRKNYRNKNKNKENKIRNNWRHTHKDQAKNTVLKYIYGIDLKQYNEILQKQNNKCGICGKDFTGKYPYKPSVDHAHDQTKRVRGLLCNKCNSALGLFNDDPKNLVKALNWLKEI
jgi:hypothetical protein